MIGDIFRGLFDDASLFPPASLKMVDAVAGHLRHQAAWYRETSGPFVCADTRLGQLSMVLTATGVTELDLALVLPGGPGSLTAATDAVFADRMKTFEAQTAPVVEHYRKLSRFEEINGDQSVEQVTTAIEAALQRLRKSK